MFHGSMVALVTPMTADGKIDEEGLIQLIEWHISEGTNAIVVIGTTGEFATLTDEEKMWLVAKVVQQVNGRIPVIAGTGTNCTAKTIQLTQQAMDLGVDACLVVTPYYNKPTQEGLYLHFKEIAEKVAIPIILYNVPSRTAVDMLPETVIRLAAIPNIVGIKEATGIVERAQIILRGCKDPLDIFSGDDLTALALMSVGARGVISVTANVVPKLMQLMCAAILNDNLQEASAINDKMLSLHKDLFVESNPIPVKWAVNAMGLISSGIRLPLTPLSEIFHERVRAAMHLAGI